MKEIKKVLIANRGEVALRIIRACKELNITSVCLFSEVDINGVWVRKADEAYPIMGNPLDAYLNIDTIISLGKKANCDAVHPGYGFLSENAEFARKCNEAGMKFIGPSAEHIELFGDKITSKNVMRDIGIPILPGTDDPIGDLDEGEKFAQEIGFPVIVKAAFGGGGRGMRIVKKAKDFKKLFQEAQNESVKYFNKDEMFIEKYLENPRHIEVQILADSHGNVVHLAERDCSIQRRHQKVVEIAPSPYLRDETRKELFRTSTNAMIKLGYESAGTIEYLVDEDENFYFMEMNTRAQVEHPVSEVISGIDIIQRMIQIAQGDKLIFLQEQLKFNGYAIEFRINAEDPKRDFAPHPGTITEYLSPGGPGVRLDTIAYKGYSIPPFYDSMIGKLIVNAIDWKGAINKARRALDEYVIEGIPTNLVLHRRIVREEEFISGKFNTGYLNKKIDSFEFTDDSTIISEEEKIANLQKVINAIKTNHLEVRH